MSESVDTANEIVRIKYDIQDIKHTQEADLHLNRDKYEALITKVLTNKPLLVKVYLAVDGTKSGIEIEQLVGGAHASVWRALGQLAGNGMIVDLEQTKGGSPIYGKPRWIRTLRIDEYVKKKFTQETSVADEPSIDNNVIQPPT